MSTAPSEAGGTNGEPYRLIAGIGASDGGIHALTAFFEGVKPGGGVAYVVELHHTPEEVALAEILLKACSMPVTNVTRNVTIAADHVYIIPSCHHLVIREGLLAVFPSPGYEEQRAPLDLFFRTLAESHGMRAVSVILSGSGTNGAMGLKRIKEEGGVVFVQHPEEAEFPEMPRHAIATGLADAVLPAAGIAEKIISYRRKASAVLLPDPGAQPPFDQAQSLEMVFNTLLSRTGHDFSDYKHSTILRRIERRMNVHQLASLSAYAAYMQDQQGETDKLLKDLLISVTNFFRDKKAFEALELDVLPGIFRGKTSRDTVRIWVAGCATGEEAYSIAMLCAEQQQQMSHPPRVQVFATDISEDAIVQARTGLFTRSDVADVHPDRLRRFFELTGDDYRIRHEVRDMVLFATQNFIHNPPFSSLDLISCRNVLIYLNPAAQERVMETFHFALQPDGYLFIGNSETLNEETGLFHTVSREQRIFQRKKSKTGVLPMSQQISSMRGIKMPRVGTRKEIAGGTGMASQHMRFRSESVPPSILVDEKYHVLHIAPGAERYLRVWSGQPTQCVLDLIRDELRFQLRAALYQASQHQMMIKVKGLEVTVEDKSELLNIIVRPARHLKEIPAGQLLVIFDTEGDSEPGKILVLSSAGTIIRSLEEEMRRLDDQLRRTNEEQYQRAEELKASNEELQAMVEELRSATEELETSREELQSINQELKVKLEERSKAGRGA